MKEKITILGLFLLIIGLAIFSLPILAAAEEKVAEEKGILEDFIPKKIGNLQIDLTASLVGGHDTNVNLNRYNRDGSSFLQQTLGVYGKYPIGDLFTLRGGYDFSSTRYFKFSDPDLLDNALSTGLDTKLADYLVWSVDYLADFVGFPHDEQSEYTLNQIGTSLNHDINDWVYQKVTYQFFRKDYPKAAVRNNWGNLRMGDRKDMRNTVIHELGLYIGDKTLVKTDNRYYRNDSNEAYLDYYDYSAFRTGLEVSHLITDKLYGSVNFAYDFKAYDKRSITDDLDTEGNDLEDQRDHLFTYGASLYYDVIPSVSVGTTVDFSKNYSNENEEQYQDLIITSGVYCSF